ncbi:MAG: hypothetical protein QM804_08885 [Propionicimonas sp.]
MGENRLDPPVESTAQVVVAKSVEAAASLLPVVGGPLSVVIATLFGVSYERRLHEWRDEVTARIRELNESLGVRIEDLAQDGAFLDALAAATRIAEMSSSAEKRAYLANALYNIGAGSDLSDDKQTIYLRYIEELTASHMVMLEFLGDPPAFLKRRGIPWPNILMGGLGAVAKVALPELCDDGPLLETVLTDLERLGLVQRLPGFNTVMTDQGLRTGRGTRKGSEFLAFITRPI